MAVTRILLIYCQRANVNNATTENTSKQTKHRTKSQFVYKLVGRVTKGAGIEVFYRSQRTRALSREQSRFVKDRSRKSRSARERSLTILAKAAKSMSCLVQCSKWAGMGRYGILALLWPAWNHTAASFWRLPYRETVLLPPNAFSGLKILRTCICCAIDPTGQLTALPRVFWDTVRESWLTDISHATETSG